MLTLPMLLILAAFIAIFLFTNNYYGNRTKALGVTVDIMSIPAIMVTLFPEIQLLPYEASPMELIIDNWIIVIILAWMTYRITVRTMKENKMKSDNDTKERKVKKPSTICSDDLTASDTFHNPKISIAVLKTLASEKKIEGRWGAWGV